MNQQMFADTSIPKPPDLYNGYTVTLLPNGKYLVAGGEKGNGSNADWEKAMLYDPVTGTWTNTGSMTSKRVFHTATLLSDGKVLVAGGCSGGDNTDLASAEIYDPSTGIWKKTGAMNVARSRGIRSTLLSDGRVLVTGGTTGFKYLSSAELYDPKTERWAMASPMSMARYGHVSILLTNGMVLIAGGKDQNAEYIFDAELYNPSNDTWTKTSPMPYDSRFFYMATMLTNGQVLLTADDDNAWTAGKELYDPASGQWTMIGPAKPHHVSSRSLDRTLTIEPESGESFLASGEVDFLVQSADRFGVSNIELFCNNVEVGRGEESPMRCTVTNMAAGTYQFFARADYANGLTSTSSPVALTFKASDPQVDLAPGPTEFISETHVKTSPAILLASVIGVNPGELASLTLNGVPQPLQMGNFVLHPALKEGENVFVLVATDTHGKTGKATTEVYLDSIAPTVSISDPTDGAAIDAMCVDVHGTFAAKDIQQIFIGNVSAPMEMPATINGNKFEAHDVFLSPGTNTIAAIAEDTAGNTTTNTITIIGPTDAKTAQTLPVQIQLSPSAGFGPLPVVFNVKVHVPGKIENVFYDFDGDNALDQTNSDLQPVTHIYKTSGEYFPAVTVQTSVGRFSSLSGMTEMLATAFGGGNEAAYVNVETPPELLSTIRIADPVDVKWTSDSNLYVLSGSMATIAEFNSEGKLVRSLRGIGASPSGLDVDSNGNVYVAVTGDNQVKKLKPTENSFALDMSFGNGGLIGSKDGRAGSNSEQFYKPFDVKLSNDGQTIIISDSGNQRLEQFGINGTWTASSSEQGGLQGQLQAPKGLALGDNGIYLFIVDSGNNRIALTDTMITFMPNGTSGTNGAALGQFNGATHLAANERALYVADTGNNRVQIFGPVEEAEGHSPVPFLPRASLSGELGLNHPKSVAAVHDLLEEKLYIADTGNNRVILVQLPLDGPETVWKHMVARLKAGDIQNAISDYSITSKDDYLKSFQALSKEDMQSLVKDMGNIQPVSIESDHAQYYFESLVDGKKITFPVDFDKEFGEWKIMQY